MIATYYSNRRRHRHRHDHHHSITLVTATNVDYLSQLPVALKSSQA